MKIFEKYASSNYPMIEQVDPALKDEAHFRKKSEAIYSLWYRGLTGTTYNMKTKFSLLRLYAQNDQPESTYKDYLTRASVSFGQDETATVAGGPEIDTNLLASADRGKKRKGYYNVLWKVVSPAKKIRSTLIGNFAKMEYDVTANPVDANSKDLVANEKAKLWWQKQDAEFAKKFSSISKVPVPEPDYIPESRDELDLFEQNGGLKPRLCEIMEKCIQHTFELGEFPEIKKMILGDAIDIGIGGFLSEYDPNLGKVLPRYIDPANVIIQWSKYPDYRDAEYFSEFIEVSAGYLLSIGMDEKFVKGVAREASGEYGNPGLESWPKYEKIGTDGAPGWVFYKVLVLDSRWIEKECRQETVKTNRHGKEIVVPASLNSTPSSGAMSRIIEKRFLYQCKWIVGTDRCYDFGKAYDMTKPSKKDVELPVHMYNFGTSVMEQLYPIFDSFMITWIKYQQAKSAAVPQGYAIDLSVLKNLKIGGKKNSEAQALKRFVESGLLFWASQTPINGQRTGTVPVLQLPGGIGPYFNEILTDFQFNISMVENLTGLNPITMGGTPDPNAPVRTTEWAMGAASNTLFPIIDGYTRIKSDGSAHIARQIQVAVRFYPEAREAYANVLSKDDVALLQMATQEDAELGIFISAKPTAQEKKEIYEAAKISLQNGRDGKPGINQADFMLIIRILEGGGSLKYADLILQDRIRKAMKLAQKMSNEGLQAQSAAQAEQAKQTAAIELQKLEAITMIELKADKERHKWKMEEIALTIGLEVGQKYLLGESPLPGGQPAGQPGMAPGETQEPEDPEQELVNPQTRQVEKVSRSQIKKKLQEKNPGEEVTDEHIDNAIALHS